MTAPAVRGVRAVVDVRHALDHITTRTTEATAVWFLVRMGIISLGAYGLYKATGVY